MANAVATQDVMVSGTVSVSTVFPLELWVYKIKVSVINIVIQYLVFVANFNTLEAYFAYNDLK